MEIRVNELLCHGTPGQTVGSVAREHKPDADVLILNGHPADAGAPLAEGDQVYLIRRGEQPTADELERLMSARHTPGVHERMKAATVGIAGAGGLGSAVAVALARIGVGRLVVADFDVVEPSNLNRQQYFIDQIGMPKVEALALNLARITPCVSVTSHAVVLDPSNTAQIFRGCTVLVEAFDRADMKAMLIDTVMEQMPGVCVVAASGLAGCGPNNSITTRRISQRLYVVGDGCSEARPGCGLMAPRVGIAAHHQANQVIRLLLGEEL